MDPIDIIIKAISAGATAASTETCKKAVRDAYEGLKSLLKRLFKKRGKESDGELILEGYEKKPKVWKEPLRDALCEASVENEKEILNAAKKLIDLVRSKETQIGKIGLTAKKAQGTVQAQKIDTVVQHFEGSGGDHIPPGGAERQQKSEEGGFKLPAGLNLEEKETDCMLWMAIRPEVKYPPCKHPTVPHAAGSAVAGLATGSISRELSNLKDRLNTCGRQMLLETEFNFQRLREYAFELAELKSVVESFAPCTSATVSAKRNLVGEVFGKLQKGNIILCGDLLQIQKTVLERIFKMQSLLDQIANDRRRNWDSLISKALRETGNEVLVLAETLGDVLRAISSLAGDVKTDWDRGVDRLWANGCEPDEGRKRTCGCPISTISKI